MSKIKILVNSTPPSGWRWQLIAENQKVLKTGTARSEVEARAMASAELSKMDNSLTKKKP
jgi:hypothetical protein